MSEYCVDCWNTIMETEEDPKMFILSPYLDLCEGCGQNKPVIVKVKRRYFFHLWWREHFPKNAEKKSGK